MPCQESKIQPRSTPLPTASPPCLHTLTEDNFKGGPADLVRPNLLAGPNLFPEAAIDEPKEPTLVTPDPLRLGDDEPATVPCRLFGEI